MAQCKYYHYYAEGETEVKMISILKTEYQCIQPGKVERFNVIHEELTGSKSNSEFKNDMLKQSNFRKKLDDKRFDFKKFWNCSATNKFSYIHNKADLVRK